MADRQARNHEWEPADADGVVPTWERVGIALLLDIRQELRHLNALLACPNFTGIPATLRAIRTNTAKRRTKKKGRA